MERRRCTKSMTINAAARYLGIQSEDIIDHIDAGHLKSIDGRIERQLLEKIHAQQEKYISLRDYLQKHSDGLFDSRLIRNREKYIDFLEEMLDIMYVIYTELFTTCNDMAKDDIADIRSTINSSGVFSKVKEIDCKLTEIKTMINPKS